VINYHPTWIIISLDFFWIGIISLYADSQVVSILVDLFRRSCAHGKYAQTG